jgi:hypothetical protein
MAVGTAQDAIGRHVVHLFGHSKTNQFLPLPMESGK